MKAQMFIGQPEEIWLRLILTNQKINQSLLLDHNKESKIHLAR